LREVLDAAALVFYERGYESASIQDIAESLGMLKGSLYYYIESKEDLLFHILEDAHDQARENIARAKAVEGDALQRIRAFVTAHLVFNASNIIRMGIAFHDLRSLSEDRRRLIIEARDEYDEFLRKLIRDGQKEGIICPDIDPRLAGFATFGMTNWIYQWYQPGGKTAAKSIANEFADIIVAGLACDRATHVPGHRRRFAALPGEAER
jgi:AcrR family transcriptional regulator